MGATAGDRVGQSRTAAAQRPLRGAPARGDRGAGAAPPRYRREGDGHRLAATRGLEATLDLTERLTAAGYATVPHISARLVRDRAHLAELLDRLHADGVRELFVLAGDAAEPAGEFPGAVELLEAMGPRRGDFDAIGITGYPESHHLISDEETIRAMFAKAPMATHIVSQLCFDAATISAWIAEVRRRGTDLPIWIGVPGKVPHAKLLRVSMKIGLGESARFLRHHATGCRAWSLASSSPTASCASWPRRHRPSRPRGRLPPLHVQRGGPDGAVAPDGSSSDSTSSVETSATRSSDEFAFTPSSSITVQNGQATASVSAPVSAASRARSSLISPARSSIHMCAPPAPQQNVRLPLRSISIG